MSAERDIVRELAESDPIMRGEGILACAICAVTRPQSAGHIKAEEHTQYCAYRHAVELIFPKLAETDEDGSRASASRIHLVE